METEPQDIAIKLSEPISDYFLFAEDQVLTANQLNRLARYLDQEDRRTRAWLIGSGIICGLGLELDETSVRLSPGCALTSDGDLLTIRNERIFTHQHPYDEKKPDYPLLQEVEEVTELLTTEAAEEEKDAAELTSEDLEDKVIILYLQSYIKEPDACTDECCEKRAPKQLNQLRVLLLPRESVEALSLSPPQAAEKLPEVSVTPVLPFVDVFQGLDSDEANELALNDRLVFHRAYRQAISNSRSNALEALETVAEHADALSRSISQPLPNWSGLLKGAPASPQVGTLHRLQPLYSFYQDFCQAYREWKDSVLSLDSACGINPAKHPKHVFLGLSAIEEGLIEEGYRHPFLRSSALEPTREESLRHSRQLWRRLHAMAQRFTYSVFSEDESQLRITPTAVCDQPLGQQAQPAYYPSPTPIPWAIDATPQSCCDPGHLLIEGFLNRPVNDVLTECRSRKKNGRLNADFFNLEFKTNGQVKNLLELFDALEAPASSLRDSGSLFTFAANCPGLTHGNTVPKGGTFVLVSTDATKSEDRLVVGAFSLPYPLKKGRYLANPGPGWEQVFALLDDQEDAEIHLPPGDYPLETPVTISRKGKLTITGSGDGTRILSTAESALKFENCGHITVRNLSGRSYLKANQSAVTHLNGLLNFLDCELVQVEGTTLTSSDATQPRACCITVRETVSGKPALSNIKPKTKVRIENNTLIVGYQQRGILVVNSARTRITDNEIKLNPEAVQSEGFKARLTVSSERKKARKSLVEKIRYVSDPDPKNTEGRNVTLRVAGLDGEIQFTTDRKARNAWESLLEKNPPPSTATSGKVINHINSLADKILTDDEFIATLAPTEKILGKVAGTVKQNTLPCGDAGITIGGVVAPDVRISGNSISGVRQGIHLGLSNNKKYSSSTYAAAGSVIISENFINTVIATDAVRAGREGIFVGGANSLSIENNRLTLQRQTGDFVRRLETDGIRVWGLLGRSIRISHNSIERFSNSNDQRFDFGIRLEHSEDDWGLVKWLILWNLIDVKQDKVRAPSGTHIEPDPQK